VTPDVPETPASPAAGPASQEWTVLFYLCGHFNRTDERDPFVSALEEIRAIGATAEMSAAIYLDLESGAQRVALRQGEPVESEQLGAVNSGDPRTLEQFLEWAFDACPARRYVLVMAGLCIMDADSVVGRPPFDSARTFAICDDRATGDAVELHELSATLRKAFPSEGPRRLVMLACDMYAMQFLEVAYELRGVLDFQVGLQPDDRHATPPLEHWPYPKLLQKWQQLAAAPSDRTPRWRSGVDPVGLELAKATVTLVSEHYGHDPEPVTVSAVNLYALVPLAQALDTFSVVYLQWLSNEVIWRAREKVVTRHQQKLELSWSYDLDEVSMATSDALTHAASEALVRWAASAVQSMSYHALSRLLRVLGASARELAKKGSTTQRFTQLADEIAVCRASVERTIAGAAAEHDAPPTMPSAEIDRAVRLLFVPADDAGAVREPAAWHAIIAAARSRFTGVHARELLDALDGIEAATQLSRLARRVSELTRGADAGRPPAIAAVWPPNRSGGLALFRPLDLNKLAESNYLQLRFSRELHWTALLTAVDLIKNHSRMLWRLLESQLTAAPLEARYQLMRRLAGSAALTGRHADQLRALSAPDALFLTIHPDDASSGAEEPSRRRGDSIVSYCVRLSSLERSAAVLERKNNVTRERLERVLTEIGRIGSDVDAKPEATLEQLARCGSLLGDDILYGISDRLSEIKPTEDRAVHLVIQVPRELMRYPWELLRDRHGWLVERFAIGRQVISDADSASKWSSTRRHGPLRLLVVAPTITGQGAEIANVGILEGEHIASSFERLQMRLPGLVQPRDYRKYVGKPVTVEQFRALIRERRFDLVHFAGHGRYDAVNPDRSCWMFSDGPLYAFELRHTLANADVTPWLIYGNACEGATDGGEERRGYHDGVYGMASAALGQGVPAYIAPLWKISETDAKNLAAAFYEALLLRRTSLGEALALARTSVRDGEEDLDVLITRMQQGPQEGDAARIVRSAGWTGMVLYGDPTPTVMQRLAPAEVRSDGEADKQRPAPTDEMSGFIRIIPGL
jgi:CHAT domain-containing protein